MRSKIANFSTFLASLDILAFLNPTVSAQNQTSNATSPYWIDTFNDLQSHDTEKHLPDNEKFEINRFLDSLLEARNQTSSYQFVQGIQTAFSQEIQVTEMLNVKITLSSILQPWIDTYFRENSSSNMFQPINLEYLLNDISQEFSIAVEEYLLCRGGVKSCLKGWSFILDVYDFVHNSVQLFRVIDEATQNSARLDLLGMGEVKVASPYYFYDPEVDTDTQRARNRHLINQLMSESWLAESSRIWER